MRKFVVAIDELVDETARGHKCPVRVEKSLLKEKLVFGDSGGVNEKRVDGSTANVRTLIIRHLVDQKAFDVENVQLVFHWFLRLRFAVF